MKSLLQFALFIALSWGCTPGIPALPELLAPGYFTPTLAAAAAITTSDSPVTPNPNNPTGDCTNCNGTGKLPERPDDPSNPNKRTCPVCGGSGKVTNDKTSSTLSRPSPYIAAIPSGKTVSSSSQSGASYQTEESGQDQPAIADDYSSINYIPVEQILLQSQRTGKPIWIHVYADGWCSECTRLKRDVFTKKEVIKASRNFICAKVEWNHPWRPKLVGDANGVPLDLFGTPDGWKSLKRAYCPKTAESYVHNLSLKLQGAN